MEENSNTSSPQDQLLAALLASDIVTFCKLLQRDDVDPSYRYDKPHYATCLEIACRKIGTGEFVRTLLRCGVKPNINNIHPEPIHYAAKKGNHEALKALLDDKRTKVNTPDSNGLTALHFAVREFGKGKHDDSMARSEKCVELLINHPDTDVNRPANKGFTAIFEAAFYGGREAVEAMLKYSKRQNKFLDLDGSRGIGKTARTLILEKYPDMEDKLPLPANRNSVN